MKSESLSFVLSTSSTCCLLQPVAEAPVVADRGARRLDLAQDCVGAFVTAQKFTAFRQLVDELQQRGARRGAQFLFIEGTIIIGVCRFKLAFDDLRIVL
jgi:hypothetical protein